MSLADQQRRQLALEGLANSLACDKWLWWAECDERDDDEW